MAHQEDQALLKAYITEWRKFFTQCNYLPTPFRQLENSLTGKSTIGLKKCNVEDTVVRKVKLILTSCSILLRILYFKHIYFEVYKFNMLHNIS